MINNDEVVALIAIGGKLEIDGHVAGLKEEINLAIEKGLQVYLIGSAGGYTNIRANEYFSEGWKEKINTLSSDQNTQLLYSYDYWTSAHMIMKDINRK